MPRTGMGQKGQAIQTATGQEYGRAGQQEVAQQIAPLPDETAPTNLPTRSQRRETVGGRGNPFRPTERVMEDIGLHLLQWTTWFPIFPLNVHDLLLLLCTSCIPSLITLTLILNFVSLCDVWKTLFRLNMNRYHEFQRTPRQNCRCSV